MVSRARNFRCERERGRRIKPLLSYTLNLISVWDTQDLVSSSPSSSSIIIIIMSNVKLSIFWSWLNDLLADSMLGSPDAWGRPYIPIAVKASVTCL